MQKIIGVTELQRKFRPYFESVVRERMPLILTRGSQPEALLIFSEENLAWPIQKLYNAKQISNIA